MSWHITPVTLSGRLVRLEPLSQRHLAGLQEATSDGEMWRTWYTPIPTPEAMAAEIESRLAKQAAGEMVPFVAVRPDGAVLGMTTYYELDADVPRLEIGYTWNRRSAHGTGTNAESKLLLLEHAFESLGCECVGFATQWANVQSRTAIERLGAKLDGVQRAATRRQGVLTDRVLYSIVRSEWPAARRGLEARLARRADERPC